MRTPIHAALLLSMALPIARADVVVIVSARNPVSAISSEQASNIFLGRTASFPGGGHAVPIDQLESSVVREEFYLKINGKSVPQMKAYWARIIFTGKGLPPKEGGGNTEIKKLVADNPDLIGYIDRGQVDSSVKILLNLH
jgi:ABC-type phosphate transport system substrate-binding protein